MISEPTKRPPYLGRRSWLPKRIHDHRRSVTRKMGKSGKQTKASSKEQEQQSQEESSPYGKFTCMKKHVAFRYKCCFHDTKLAALSLSLSTCRHSLTHRKTCM